MKKSFSKLFLAPLTVLILAGFAMAPVAEARGGETKKVNNSNRDERSNDVRSTSVNNVSNKNVNVNTNKNVNVNVNANVNRNVNVNVSNHGGGWDNDYHPVATAAAVTAVVVVTSAVIGSMVRTIPPNCVPVNYGGMIYQQCGGTWYQPQSGQYVVIKPPY
jgi:hypothetical protein